eukprot:COSAG01_NODE_16728_length_1210_cov_2.943294_1_plen_26_part_01
MLSHCIVDVFVVGVRGLGRLGLLSLT